MGPIQAELLRQAEARRGMCAREAARSYLDRRRTVSAAGCASALRHGGGARRCSAPAARGQDGEDAYLKEAAPSDFLLEVGASAWFTVSCGVAAGVRGEYLKAAENHGRPSYKRIDQKEDEAEVSVYFRDDRDGLEMSGWWFGSESLGDEVWFYHPDHTAKTPPLRGWMVPFNGLVDHTLIISAQEVALTEHALSELSELNELASRAPLGWSSSSSAMGTIKVRHPASKLDAFCPRPRASVQPSFVVFATASASGGRAGGRTGGQQGGSRRGSAAAPSPSLSLRPEALAGRRPSAVVFSASAVPSSAVPVPQASMLAAAAALKERHRRLRNIEIAHASAPAALSVASASPLAAGAGASDRGDLYQPRLCALRTGSQRGAVHVDLCQQDSCDELAAASAVAVAAARCEGEEENPQAADARSPWSRWFFDSPPMSPVTS